MFHVLLRTVVLSILIAVMPAAAWAGAGDKLGTLLRDYDSISRDLHKMQLTQSDLIKQKAILDNRGSALSKRQDTLNAHPRDPNAAAADRQKTLDQNKNKSKCNNQGYMGGKNTPQHVDGCDNKAKRLMKMSIAVNAGVLPLETRQTGLDLEYNQYDEAADDWNAQEQQTITALNSLYRALNIWVDRADDFMAGTSFQQEVQAKHARQACLHSALPDGMLSIDELQDYAAGAEGCLRYVAAHGG